MLNGTNKGVEIMRCMVATTHQARKEATSLVGRWIGPVRVHEAVAEQRVGPVSAEVHPTSTVPKFGSSPSQKVCRARGSIGRAATWPIDSHGGRH
jgi:hypothetical protein